MAIRYPLVLVAFVLQDLGILLPNEMFWFYFGWLRDHITIVGLLFTTVADYEALLRRNLPQLLFNDRKVCLEHIPKTPIIEKLNHFCTQITRLDIMPLRSHFLETLSS